jgi:hypothetical protein
LLETSPLGLNPLVTRSHLQQAVRDLCTPLEPHASDGGARVRLAATAAQFPPEAAELEGFARPLWGLAPLLAGGGTFEHWPRYQAGLANGSNPMHPEFWGRPRDHDQRIIEMAAIGFSLALSPEAVWSGLDPAARSDLSDWLNAINDVEVFDNNWLWCRVLVNLGLERVGAEHDPLKMQIALRRLERFYLGDGWYSDGPTAQRDYYVAFMHFYALIYAKLAAESDAARAELFRQRAALFAGDFIRWFAPDGSALPFGRSLTYRFAQSAFWGALAFADVEAASWGIVKGVLLRNIRFWARQPIFTDGGILSVGYGYPNLLMAEQYNSPASPYWAMKSFLPLALPESHPFWQAEEEHLPLPLTPGEAAHAQEHPGMILCRDEPRGHVFALAGGQYSDFLPRHVAEKYSKFAYSTAFAFSVPSAQTTEEAGAHDSMLALTEDKLYFRVRHKCLDARIERGVLYSRWRPFEDVEIETWLVPLVPWHVRIHRLQTKRPLFSRESGFAIPCDGARDAASPRGSEEPSRPKTPHALTVQAAGATGLHDLIGRRKGRILNAHPNTNLMHPRTVIPTLLGEHASGEHWLACAVVGLPGETDTTAFWNAAPSVSRDSDTLSVFEPGGDRVVLSLPMRR